MLEDAGRPAVHVLAVLAPGTVLPAGRDVQPAPPDRLESVQGQTSLIEGRGLLPDRLVGGVDNDPEGQFIDLARIVLVVADMVLDDGDGQAQAHLGRCQSHARGLKHGGAHGLEQPVQSLGCQLTLVGLGLLAQDGLAHLHDRQELLFAGLGQHGFHPVVEIGVEGRLSAEHG